MMTDRARVLRAIRKCLSDCYGYFQETMDELDEVGRGSLGTGMTPLVGGYAMSDPKNHFRQAIMKLDRAEKALRPLATRFRDGRVNASHFVDERALMLLRDLTEFDYQILFTLLAQRRGRESVWYRLKELSQKAKEVFDLVATE
ncbi:MAG: hypothetical protein DRO73_07090 [Candidatus Thorarchaeota archaeon]|nr:MAG: hypothetical protein DRO73_07090 [Candidatus Thorarchaeota archaeon]